MLTSIAVHLVILHINPDVTGVRLEAPWKKLLMCVSDWGQAESYRQKLSSMNARMAISTLLKSPVEVRGKVRTEQGDLAQS